MDLDGDGLKDYACVDPKTGGVKVHINIPDADGKTSGYWKTPKTVVTPMEARDGYGVMFAEEVFLPTLSSFSANTHLV